MAVTSGFFNSQNGDRKYNAEQFSALFDNLITDGVFANVGTAFQVTATSDSTISIGIGRAWFNSTWIYNDAIYPMTPREPEVLLNRIDAIVIEINRSEAVRMGQIRWVYGTAESEPSPPVLTNTDEVHQYPLAYVSRRAGVSKVIQADIMNMIGTSSCPYVTGILSTQDIDKVVAQWESQFNIWFESLQTELDGDVATNLANQILDIESRFHDLARDRAVYETLQDSSNSEIKDSNNSPILARTVLGSGDVIVADSDTQFDDNFKIGDILHTVRNNLGSRWRICDGSILERSEYQELSDHIPVTFDNPWIHTYLDGTGETQPLSKVVYGHNYYVGVKQMRVLIENRNPKIYYSTNLASWTEITLPNDTDSPGRSLIENIVFLNGYFIVLGAVSVTDATNGDETVAIWVATDPTSSANWTKYTLTTGASSSEYCRYASDIIYDDKRNIYVVCGVVQENSDYSSAAMWASGSFSELASNRIKVDFNRIDHGGVLYLLKCGDYYSIVISDIYNRPHPVCYILKIDPEKIVAGTMTKYEEYYWLDHFSSCGAIYEDGALIVAGRYEDHNHYDKASIAFIKVFNTGSIDTMFASEFYKLSSDYEQRVPTDYYPSFFAKENGLYIISGIYQNIYSEGHSPTNMESDKCRPIILYSSSLDSIWKEASSLNWYSLTDSGNYISVRDERCVYEYVMYANGKFILSGPVKVGFPEISNGYWGAISVLDQSKLVLPKLSSNNSHVYIKAK